MHHMCIHGKSEIEEMVMKDNENKEWEKRGKMKVKTSGYEEIFFFIYNKFIIF